MVNLFASRIDAAERPNILWLSTEDMSPNLGCYGDEQARTPNIDKLAAEGVRFENAFVPCPVCATCRGSIITGVYSVSLGSHHMRSRVKLPAEIRCFPEYLREAGYYCTNNSKEDYNFRTPPTVWDESSGKAHWRNRPDKEAPFFAVFNFTGTHESSIRGDEPKYSQVTSVLEPDERHDPVKLKLPPYYPDTPKVREHWARYYNVVTSLDHWIADRLRELDEAGLADDTIVFFWSDHGAGIPRHKRWLYDTGLHVPLVVRVPEKWRKLVPVEPGQSREELVSLVDLGATVLRIADLPVPDYMDGQSLLAAESAKSSPREYVFGARDRMDETYDMARSVRDSRFKYIRNYMPWRPYAQTNSYGDNSDIMRELRRLHAAGELDATQELFMRDRRPVEELYDLKNDPYELNNLAKELGYVEILKQLSDRLDEWMLEVRDVGIVPEGMLTRLVPKGGTRYELLRGDEQRYRSAASAANYYAMRADDEFTDDDRLPELDLPVHGLFPDPIVEYWSAMGSSSARQDESADDAVRVMAAEGLLLNDPSDAQRDAAIDALIEIYRNGRTHWDQTAAAGVLDLHVDEIASLDQLAKANRKVASTLEGVRRNTETGVTSLRNWVQRFRKVTRGADGSKARSG